MQNKTKNKNTPPFAGHNLTFLLSDIQLLFSKIQSRNTKKLVLLLVNTFLSKGSVLICCVFVVMGMEPRGTLYHWISSLALFLFFTVRKNLSCLGWSWIYDTPAWNSWVVKIIGKCQHLTFFSSTGGTQGCTHARWVLCHWSALPARVGRKSLEFYLVEGRTHHPQRQLQGMFCCGQQALKSISNALCLNQL